MSDVTTMSGDVVIQGRLIVNGTRPALARSELLQSDNDRYKIPWGDWRTNAAFATVLPGTSSGSDLAIVGGTFGSASPSIQTSDVKALGTTTRYARCAFQLPAEYVTGQSVSIVAHAGMLTTISDGAATVDFECYRSNDEAGIGSDLVTTSATTIKSLTLADKTFVVDSATLAPGDTLDIRMTIAITDAATVTAVKGIVGAVTLLLDVKG